MSHSRLSAFCVAATLTLAGPAVAQAESHSHAPIPQEALEGFVDGLVRAGLEDHHIAGATVSIVQGGKVVLLKGYGVADANNTPVDPSRTVFRIGSVSKTFMWTTLLQEADEGLVKLDAPVNDYLPDALKVPAEGFQPITFLHLMSHTPGFEEIGFGHFWAIRPERIVPEADYLRLHRPHRMREPGVASTYSNYGAALAGHAAVLADKVPDFATLVEKRILKPAGMTSTTFRENYPPRADLPTPMPAEMSSRLAKGMKWNGVRFEEGPSDFITNLAPAGSGYSTAADMARYMQLWLNRGEIGGARVYSEKAAQAMRTPIVTGLPEGSNGWNHGFVDMQYPAGLRAIGHNGGTMFFLTQMMMVPDLDLGVFISTNTPGGGKITEDLPRRIVAHFYGDEIVPVRPGDTNFKERSATFTGDYLHTRRAFKGLEGFVFKLVSHYELGATEDGYLILDGTQLYAPTSDPNLFRNRQGEDFIWFKLGEDGKAIEFRQGSNSVLFERAKWWQSRTLLMGCVVLVGLSIAVAFIGLITRPFLKPATTGQRRSMRGELLVGLLWIAGSVAFGLWVMGSNDDTQVTLPWPGPLMGTAAWMFTLAAIGTLILLLALPRNLRASGGWSTGRKLRHAGAVLSFASLSLVLLALGALSPLG